MIDKKEIKILSDILALVLDEEDGQSIAAITALKTRAQKNDVTGGALKNLFQTIVVDPPRPTLRRAPTSARTNSTHEDLSLRQQVQALTTSLQRLDVKLRQAESEATALRHEVARAHKAHTETQSLLNQEIQVSSRGLSMVCIALCAGMILGVAATELFHAFSAEPPIDRASYLNYPLPGATQSGATSSPPGH